jgi:hypothetical protein
MGNIHFACMHERDAWFPPFQFVDRYPSGRVAPGTQPIDLRLELRFPLLGCAPLEVAGGMEPRGSFRFSREPLVLLHTRNVEVVVVPWLFGIRVQPRKTCPGRPSSDSFGVEDLYGAACLCQVVSDRAPDNASADNYDIQCRRPRDRCNGISKPFSYEATATSAVKGVARVCGGDRARRAGAAGGVGLRPVRDRPLSLPEERTPGPGAVHCPAGGIAPVVERGRRRGPDPRPHRPALRFRRRSWSSRSCEAAWARLATRRPSCPSRRNEARRGLGDDVVPGAGRVVPDASYRRG